jgi:hypothetical protein
LIRPAFSRIAAIGELVKGWNRLSESSSRVAGLLVRVASPVGLLFFFFSGQLNPKIDRDDDGG